MKTVKFLLMALVATAFVGCNDSDDSTSKIHPGTGGRREHDHHHLGHRNVERHLERRLV